MESDAVRTIVVGLAEVLHCGLVSRMTGPVDFRMRAGSVGCSSVVIA